MTQLTQEAQILSQIISEPQERKSLLGEETISVSKAVSMAAVIYEAARNAIEFRAEHLIRRAAIERILKRRIMINPTGRGTAEALIKELLWARYLENGSIPKKIVEEIQKTIDKYLLFRQEIIKTKSPREKKYFSDWILGIASCEIEKKLVPAPKREALINFVYRTLRKKIIFPFEENQKTYNMQIYIATHRGFALSDEPIIRFHLFISFFPDWMDFRFEEALKIVPYFEGALKEIESQLNYPLKDQLRRHVLKEAAPFNVIRDLIEEYPLEFKKIILNPQILEEKIKKILNKKYQETKNKLKRAAIRGIIYIFLTKMIFAFILEIPFELLIKKINYFSLIVNSLFPPFLMFLVTTSIKIPGEENTNKIIEKIKEYIYINQPIKTKIEINSLTKRKITNFVFTPIYFLTYILIFGGVIFLLSKAHFNVLSQIIFLFFLSVVSFFGYRIRLLTKDYEIEEKEGILAPILDFLFLPILRIGQWLSRELAHINILIFIFDFIIEAPFKAFFEVIEQWIHFIKIKKEEITT